MLSPHEFATLILINDAPDQVELHRPELNTLLAYQLVSLEAGVGGRRLRITDGGNSVLRAFPRIYESTSFRRERSFGALEPSGVRQVHQKDDEYLD